MAQVGVPSVQSTEFAELLVQSGLITQHDLALARAAKARTGSHIDEILVNQGIVSPPALRHVMAQAWGLPVLDLHVAPHDSAFMHRWSGQMMIAASIATMGASMIMVSFRAKRTGTPATEHEIIRHKP